VFAPDVGHVVPGLLQSTCLYINLPFSLSLPPQIKVLPCGHEFHSGCLDSWLELKAMCPLCKVRAIAPPWLDKRGVLSFSRMVLACELLT